MQKAYRNIYKTARNYTGYTQEVAAELVGISVESLRGYERGATIPPSVIVLKTSVLQLQKEMADTKAVSSEMIEITCDGKVEKHEENRWAKVHKELRDLVGAALSVIFAPLQKEKPPVLAHRR